MPDSPVGSPVKTKAPWAVVIILLVLYICSFVDRAIINMMVGPIERDLHISDFEMSLLLGPAFGLFYVFSGLFMGLLVDKMPRRLITAIGVACWGLATFLSGFAGNFVHLAIGRIGVGVGESTLTPAAHALIADSFPPRQLATAMSVFTLGAVVGAAIANIVGGAVVHAVAEKGTVQLPLLGSVHGWQAVFLCVGAITLLLLPLVWFIAEDRNAAAGRLTASANGRSALRFSDLIWRHWRLYLLLPLGFGCTNIMTAAYLSWVPTFMMRTYAMNAGEVGLMLGIQVLITGLVGQIGGAVIVDRLYARGVRDAHTRYHILGLCLTGPVMVLAFLAGDRWTFILLFAIFNCITYPFIAYAAAAMQIFTPGHLRGRTSALFLAFVTTVGLLIGPPLTGWFNDHVYGKDHLGSSLATVSAIAAPIAIAILAYVGRYMRRIHQDAPPSID